MPTVFGTAQALDEKDAHPIIIYYIICEFIPTKTPGLNEVTVMKAMEEQICIPRCGFYKEANAKANVKLLCFHPQNPYLQQLANEMNKTGKGA